MNILPGLTFLFLLGVTLSVFHDCHAQRGVTRAAVVTYKMEIETEDVRTAELMKESELVLAFRDSLVRIESSVAGGMTTIIVDAGNLRGLYYQETIGERIAMKLDQDAILKEGNKTPFERVMEPEKGEKILGYECKSIEMLNETGDQFRYYYTPQIDPPYMLPDYKIPGQTGLPLKIVITEEGSVTTITAVDVITKEVPLSLFLMVIPEGYTEIHTN